MTEKNKNEMIFYQSDDILYKTIAPLIIKILNLKENILIYSDDNKLIEIINNGLWSFSKTKFIPHLTYLDKENINETAVFITNSYENKNNADYLIIFSKCDDSFLKKFKKIFYFFDRSNILKAKNDYNYYKDQQFLLKSYKKDKNSWMLFSF